VKKDRCRLRQILLHPESELFVDGECDILNDHYSVLFEKLKILVE